jgi:hypothetical protein
MNDKFKTMIMPLETLKQSVNKKDKFDAKCEEFDKQFKDLEKEIYDRENTTIIKTEEGYEDYLKQLKDLKEKHKKLESEYKTHLAKIIYEYLLVDNKNHPLDYICSNCGQDIVDTKLCPYCSAIYDHDYYIQKRKEIKIINSDNDMVTIKKGKKSSKILDNIIVENVEINYKPEEVLELIKQKNIECAKYTFMERDPSTSKQELAEQSKKCITARNNIRKVANKTIKDVEKDMKNLGHKWQTHDDYLAQLYKETLQSEV